MSEAPSVEAVTEALAALGDGDKDFDMAGMRLIVAAARDWLRIQESETIWWCEVHKQKATGWPHGGHARPTSCPHWWRYKDCAMVERRLI